MTTPSLYAREIARLLKRDFSVAICSDAGFGAAAGNTDRQQRKRRAPSVFHHSPPVFRCNVTDAVATTRLFSKVWAGRVETFDVDHDLS
ncbi:hypothetical protein [Paraburkholderia terricola]|uniref:hypothetical protein n=1 Tax=Paraburkholderia terricola TaxID=169427 RepID=UPI00115FAF10|nr:MULTISPECIES: hypothetical protein [Paraburkholderia]